MKRVMLTVAYNGTNYHGLQIQPNVVTVESVLNETLSALLQEEIKVIGASRTDTGVHALGNIAVFDTQARMPAEKISYALNQRLPQDICIQASKGTYPLRPHPSQSGYKPMSQWIVHYPLKTASYPGGKNIRRQCPCNFL